MAALVTALMAAFIPGASPPEVRTPIVEILDILITINKTWQNYENFPNFARFSSDGKNRQHRIEGQTFVPGPDGGYTPTLEAYHSLNIPILHLKARPSIHSITSK